MTENDKLMDVLSKWNGNVHFGGSGAIQNDALELLQYRVLGTVEDFQRLVTENSNLRNELCQKCGRYREAHNGACNGCKWRKEDT